MFHTTNQIYYSHLMTVHQICAVFWGCEICRECLGHVHHELLERMRNTVDNGWNMLKPYKSWDKTSINWCRISQPSTVVAWIIHWICALIHRVANMSENLLGRAWTWSHAAMWGTGASSKWCSLEEQLWHHRNHKFAVNGEITGVKWKNDCSPHPCQISIIIYIITVMIRYPAWKFRSSKRSVTFLRDMKKMDPFTSPSHGRFLEDSKKHRPRAEGILWFWHQHMQYAPMWYT